MSLWQKSFSSSMSREEKKKFFKGLFKGQIVRLAESKQDAVIVCPPRWPTTWIVVKLLLKEGTVKVRPCDLESFPANSEPKYVRPALRCDLYNCPWRNCMRVFDSLKSRRMHMIRKHRGYPIYPRADVHLAQSSDTVYACHVINCRTAYDNRLDYLAHLSVAHDFGLSCTHSESAGLRMLAETALSCCDV